MLLAVAGENLWDGRSIPVPDDARELDADRWAYLAELRRKAAGIEPAPHPGRWSRWSSTPGGTGRWDVRTDGRWGGAAERWNRAEWSTRLGLVALLAVACVSALSLVLAARLTPVGAPLPLAQAAAAAPGADGGLLPDVTVSTPYGLERDLRAVRPAVLAVVPAECACHEELRLVQRLAHEAGVPLWLVGPDQQELLRLRAVTGHSAGVLLDSSGLGEAYGSTGLTLVTVHADGVVGDVLRNLDQGGLAPESLRPLLQDLPSPGA